MKTLLAAILVFFIPLYAFCLPSDPRSFGLNGCTVTSLSATSSRNFVFAGCYQSARGIYYSVDFGKSWVFASGGDYTSGDVLWIQAGDSYVFMESNGYVYRSALPTSGTSWSPDFHQVGEVREQSHFQLIGNYLYILRGDNRIYVINAVTGAEVQAVDLPTSTFYPYASMAFDGTNLFVALSQQFAAGIFLRYDIGSDGKLSNLFTPSLPSDSYVSSLMTNPPSGQAFAIISTTSGSHTGQYRSMDHGATWNPVGDTSAPGICYSGSAIMAGNSLTTDGSTWRTIMNGRTPDGTMGIVNGACIMDAVDPNIALFSWGRGVVKTRELLGVDPLFEDSSSGLTGINVWEIAQNSGRKDRVLATTGAGFPLCTNFTAESPTWSWICPHSDPQYCESGGHIASDANDPDKMYVSLTPTSGIYKGSFDASGAVTWNLLATLADYGVIMQLATSTFMPGTLVVARGTYAAADVQTGKLSFLSSSDGSVLREAFEGLPVFKFVAVSSSIYFAAVGLPSSLMTRPATWGLYRSTDAGEIVPIPVRI